MIAQGGTFAGQRYLSEESLKQMTSTLTGDLLTQYGFGFATRKGMPATTAPTALLATTIQGVS